MKSKIFVSVFYLILFCNHSHLKQLDEEESLNNNGTKSTFSLNYLANEIQNKKPSPSTKIQDDKIPGTLSNQETLIPLSISNDVVSSGLSETGQVPVVLTVLDSGTSDLNQRASHIVKHDLEVIKNKTRLIPKITLPPQNESTINLVDQTVDNVVSTSLPNLSVQQPVPPPAGGENHTEIKNDTVESPSSEDIPSFREWTQKQLAEAEKKKGENLTISAPVSNNVKIRSKNYASLDCGAKIVGSTAEAKSPNSVLSPSRDEYILNTCNSKIWFVVELCESIQAKKIELANFELFSSSPKDFTVSVADRWPTKDWTVVGILTAKDERTIQSFTLQPSLFAKYVKLEFHSHYGSEHYCPVSLLRVFGSSELDVLDSDPHELNDIDDDDDVEDSESGEAGNNIFGSARDAVISIVKKAAEVLTPHSKNATGVVQDENVSLIGDIETAPLDLTCITPSHIIVCDNCTDDLFSLVYNILSCHSKQIEELFQGFFINQVLRQTHICQNFGLKFSSIQNTPKIINSKTTEIPRYNDQVYYVNSMLSEESIASLCNYLAIVENKVVLNVTDPSNTDEIRQTNQVTRIKTEMNDMKRILSETNEDNLKSQQFSSQNNDVAQICTIESSLIAYPKTSSNFVENANINIPSKIFTTQKEFYENSVLSQIRPTKTLDKVNVDRMNVVETEEMTHILMGATTSTPDFGREKVEIVSQDSNSNEDETELTPEVENILSNSKRANGLEDRNGRELSPDVNTFPSTPPQQVPEEESSQNVESLEKLFSELEAAEQQPASASASPPQQLKESVLIRLANRIKSLERNMSLSGQYLDELSRRYKRQIEDMTRALNEALEERKRGEIREMKLTHELGVLAEQLATLTVSVDAILSERDSWMYKVSMVGQHTIIIFIELIIFCAVLFLCRLLPQVEITQRKISIGWHKKTENQSTPPPQRRVSDTVLGESGSGEPKKRRPSEEALRSSGATHSELIIADVKLCSNNSNHRLSKAEKRRKRKKKEVKLKMSSSHGNLPNTNSYITFSDRPLKRTSSDDHASWCDQVNENLLIKNSFQPLYLHEQSPDNSPIAGSMFTTAMNARHKRSSTQPPLVNVTFHDKNVELLTAPQNSSRGSRGIHLDSSNSSNTLPSSATSSVVGTPKKSSGFKKIVKKFF